MGVSPYLAPTYFPPSFFYSAIAGDSTTTPTAGTPYYAPTYFPPSFFYSAIAGDSTTTPTAGTSYYAPTYFPPSFFYSTGTVSSTNPIGTTTGATPYNAPTYFPPSYFYGSGTSTTPTPTPTPTPPLVDPTFVVGCDQSSYATLMSLIRGLGVFETVIFGSAVQRSQAGADCYPLAVLTPKGWEESDEYDPTSIVRRVTFGITIVVRSQDGEPQFDQLDWLSTSILQAVDFSSLGSLNLPPLTRIRAGRYDSSSHYPEQSVELEGEFCSLIDRQALVSVTN